MTTVSKSADDVLREHATKDPSGCLLWTGSSVKGYGKLKRGGRTVYAHRFAYEVARGPIPAGLVIDHLCRTPLCVNVDHLEAVTPRVNTLRGASSPAVNARKTHCIRGHEFTPANTAVRSGGRRKCRTCWNFYCQARRRGLSVDAYLSQLAGDA